MSCLLAKVMLQASPRPSLCIGPPRSNTDRDGAAARERSAALPRVQEISLEDPRWAMFTH